eukprot:s3336_g2.t3
MLSIVGLEDTFACYTVQEFAAGFKKTLAFQPRLLKHNRVSAGEGIWIIKRKAGNYCTSFDVLVFLGAKDTLCNWAMLNIGLEDTLAYYKVEEFAAGFKKTQAFQTCFVNQNRGSSGEGIWIIKLKAANMSCGKGLCTEDEVLDLMALTPHAQNASERKWAMHGLQEPVASAPRPSRERRSGGDVEDSADSLQALWSQWVARATASSHCGLLHLAALSAAAKRLFESLGLPQEEGALKLATVDCGPAPSLRVFARQSDQTAAIEISESQSRLEANDAECCFLIFGFGGRMRSPPSDRPDFVVNCSLIRSTAAPCDQFQKWQDAFARCRLLEAVDAGRRSQKSSPFCRPSSKKVQSNADSLVREVLRKCSDFDKAQHYLNWFHQNMGKTCAQIQPDPLGSPDAAGRVLTLEEVTEAQLRVMQFFEEGGGKRDSSSSDASSSSSYKPRRGRPPCNLALELKSTAADNQLEPAYPRLTFEDGYPVQHWEDCAREVLPGYEGFNRRATAVMIKSEVGQGQLQVTFDEQAACPPLQPHQEAVGFLMHPKSPDYTDWASLKQKAWEFVESPYQGSESLDFICPSWWNATG